MGPSPAPSLVLGTPLLAVAWHCWLSQTDSFGNGHCLSGVSVGPLLCIAGRGGTPEDPGDFVTHLSAGFCSPWTVVLWMCPGLFAHGINFLGTSQRPWFHFCLWEFGVFSLILQWCLEPGGHCSVRGEGQGAVGAGQPWSGFSTSSHESLGVLGRSLTWVLCPASIWYSISQGQPWSPALPWGHRSVPLAFPVA